MTQRAPAILRWFGVAALSAAIAAPAAAEPPTLVVILVVDQFRADYIDRYGDRWTKGLRRLIDDGAWFREAAYPYQGTVTCAGHATVATGAFPATHGMIGNSWWDRSSGQSVRCTIDPDAPLVSYGGSIEGGESSNRLLVPTDPDAPLVSYGEPNKGGESPHRLLVPTLSDELRAQLDGATRVVTMSLKERSAIMLAGHRGDAVTWMGARGAWVTSSAFTSEPVPFLQAFIDEHPLADALGDRWTRLLPVEQYRYDDAADGERPPGDWDGTFPHELVGEVPGEADRRFITRWRSSPFSDDYLGWMAVAAIGELELGQRGTTDYLGIGFSALDLVGHRFGPRSHEIQDVLARLDATIGTLLDELDRRVGSGRYVVGLSADHGVSPIPEQMAELGFDAGRTRGRQMLERLESALTPYLGPGNHVAGRGAGGVYFAPGVYARLLDDPRALAAALDAVETSPGILRAFRGDTLPSRRESGDVIERAAALSYYPGRSGDLIVAQKPYWTGAGRNAASHGTANLYDRRVPVVLFGAGIRPGEYRQAATPADIAPTLAQLTGITLAQPDGRVLGEALQN